MHAASRSTLPVLFPSHRLFFLDGARLHDPERLLEGEGKQVRGIRLTTPADMDKPAIAALIAQAVAPHRDALAAAPPLSTVSKTEADKQRPRRPAASTQD